MPFNPLGFALTSAVTRDMPDRARATQLSLLGGLLGNNLAGVALIAAAARQDRTTTTGTTTEAPVERPTRVQVPELPDNPQEATAILRSRDLVPVIARVTSSEEPMDTVIGSDPAAEEIVRRGSTVTVLVSGGVEVPDVVGKPLEEAVELVEAAGFVVDTTPSKKKGREDHVESQEPGGGTFADGESTVTLTVFPKKAALRAADEEPEE
jgi:serine/threonine-protein kinase